jgi:hypothetical protein
MKTQVRSPTAIIVSALTIAFAWSVGASATPQQLDCVLTDTEAKPGSESRPIVIVFDEDAKTLTAKEGDHIYSFSKISISQVSINGLDDNVSLGIDRSALGIVWQQYEMDQVRTEYGKCHPVRAPT